MFLFSFAILIPFYLVIKTLKVGNYVYWSQICTNHQVTKPFCLFLQEFKVLLFTNELAPGQKVW